MSETVRTFVAIDTSNEARLYASELQETLRGEGAAVRWVTPEQFHLTLKFLGNVPEEQIENLKAELEQAAEGVGPLELAMGGAGQFPPSGQPRVVWVGIEESTGRLSALQEAVESACEPFAEKEEPGRKFHAHITLGRVKEPKKAASLAKAIADEAQKTGPNFRAEEVLLMASQLTPKGPIYRQLARIPLKG